MDQDVKHKTTSFSCKNGKYLRSRARQKGLRFGTKVQDIKGKTDELKKKAATKWEKTFQTMYLTKTSI